MKSRTLVASLIVGACSLLLALLLSPSAGRASGGSNLLQNPGFEEGTKGWSKLPLDATFIVTDTPEYVQSGTWAASLNRTDGVIGQIHISQYVEDIIGGMSYALSGWAYKDDPSFQSVYLQIQWWDSTGPVDEVDTDWLTFDEPNYRFLYTEPVRAPDNAVKARIKCVAHIQEPNSETPVFFDDLSFTFQGSKVYLPLVVKDY